MLKYDVEYDAVVVGLGTAGAIAALVMGEAGLKVCGIEKLNMAGGTATAGGVPAYYYGLRGGRFAGIDAEAEKLRRDFIDGGHFHFDAKEIVLEQELLAAGVDLYFETVPFEVHLSEDRKSVRGVTVNTAEGIRRIGCRVLLDGSGNGDVCALAGAGFRLGRESDGKCQPYSSIRTFVRDRAYGWANFDAGYAKCDDAVDFTRAIIHSNALHVKAENDPQDDLLFITSLPSLREGRLVECDECLTAEDFLRGKSSGHKALGYAYSNFDDHSHDLAFLDRVNRDLTVIASLWGKRFHVPITLEMMLVKGFENLLVTGRALSVDHMMASLLRMQPCLQKSGEIAAEAVIRSIKRNIPLREVDRDELAAALRASGCLNTDLPDLAFSAADAEIRELLDSESPGEAIWLTGMNLPRYRELLLEVLSSDRKDAAAHSALALAIGGDEAGLPVLRKQVRERDPFVTKSSPGHNQPRLLAAVDLLGRFGHAEDAELLMQLQAQGELQLCSHIIRSLLELGDALAESRTAIRNSIESLLQNDQFNDMLLLKNSSNLSERVYEPQKPSLRKMANRHFENWNSNDTGNRTFS